MIHQYCVEKSEEGVRVDIILAKKTGYSRATILRWLAAGRIRIRGVNKLVKGHRVLENQILEISGDLASDIDFVPKTHASSELEILYQDNHYLVVNKPVGMACHPLRPEQDNTVANRVINQYPECGTASSERREGGVCHRLDNFTSGTLIFARHRQAWVSLREAFAQDRITKNYYALISGQLYMPSGEIEIPLVTDQGTRVKRATQMTQKALSARTRFKVIEQGDNWSWVDLAAQTGRRHQIRAHMSLMSVPLWGDELYDGPPWPQSLLQDARQAQLDSDFWPQAYLLHAYQIQFPAFDSSQIIKVTAPLSSIHDWVLNWFKTHYSSEQG